MPVIIITEKEMDKCHGTETGDSLSVQYEKSHPTILNHPADVASNSRH